MFGPILDVAIGLVFTFLLFSILLSTVNEVIAAVLKLRARALEDAFVRLIENPAAPKTLLSYFIGLFGRAKKTRSATPAGGLSYGDVYNHPLVGGAQGNSAPSYVPADQFASALMAVLRGAATGKLEDDVANAVAALPPGKLRDALTAIVGEAQGNLDKLKTGIENWFNAAMDRLSGDYKRFSQLAAFVIALALAVVFNVDAVNVSYRLYNEPALREAMVQSAGDFVKKNGPPAQTSCTPAGDPKLDDVKACKAAIEKASAMLLVTAPVGWAPRTDPAGSRPVVALSVVGWLITALAGMMGSAYWFQLLTKLINLRGTGPKPEEKKKP